MVFLKGLYSFLNGLGLGRSSSLNRNKFKLKNILI